MGIFSTDTITLYNKHIDDTTGKAIYIPTVIAGIQLVETKGANIASSGMSDADGAKVFVDMSVVNNHTKQYLSPREYMSKSNKTNYFTFDAGEDFFVKGDKSSIEVQEYAFYEYMREHYDGVYIITNVDIYDKVMPHFEIGGK